MDMFYDHFLAKDWHIYHKRPLDHYLEDVYALIDGRKHLLSQQALLFFNQMRKHKWLSQYASTQGIGLALSSLSERTNFDSGMEHAEQALIRDYTLLREEFHAFFPQIQDYISAVSYTHLTLPTILLV